MQVIVTAGLLMSMSAMAGRHHHPDDLRIAWLAIFVEGGF